jgi:hypothetical protein
MPGDLNVDGAVNFDDLLIFVNAYVSFHSSTHRLIATADFDNNLDVNFDDLLLFVNYYVSSPHVAEGGTGRNTLDDNSETMLTLTAPALLPDAGGTFNVSLHVDNVTNLWGWGGSLFWDPNVINLTSVSEGPFLKSTGDTMFLSSMGDQAILNGTLQDMGDALMSDSTVNGSGDLATLTFQVLDCQPTSITITDVGLYAPGIELIPCTTSDLTIAYDILATNVTSQLSFVQTGGFPLPVNVTLQNFSNLTQTVTVQVSANGGLIGTGTFNVTGGSVSNVTCTCNTTNLAVGNYTLSACAFASGEGVSSFGSTQVGNTVLVTYTGDLTGNFIVDIDDLLAYTNAYVLYRYYGIYNPAADYNHDGVINSTDQTLWNNAYNYYLQHH